MKPAVLLTAALLLGGCPGTVTRLAAPRSESLHGGKEVRVRGDYVHPASGMVFPEQVEGFTRDDEITQYDVKGDDVSMGYNAIALEGNLACTVYVYPGPRMSYVFADPKVVEVDEKRYVKEELQLTEEDIERAHPDWVLTKEEDSHLHPPVAGQMAEYKFSLNSWMGEVPMISSDHIFLADHRWFVQLRFTYPAASREVHAPDIERLVSALRWPGEKPE